LLPNNNQQQKQGTGNREQGKEELQELQEQREQRGE